MLNTVSDQSYRYEYLKITYFSEWVNSFMLNPGIRSISCCSRYFSKRSTWWSIWECQKVKLLIPKTGSVELIKWFHKEAYIFIKNWCITKLVLFRVIKLQVIFLHERLLKILEVIICEQSSVLSVVCQLGERVTVLITAIGSQTA